MEIINKKKLLNDPVYGFINIPNSLILDIIEHPFFQRLRRISQLGMSYLVYPGAHHTRFHHALGSMHLMSLAIESLRNKEIEINKEEEEGLLLAILLHDIGHGPFSHALEHSIVKETHHEHLSSLFIRQLNEEFNGKLNLAVQIFEGKYPKKFLHQLVSSQLDVDRLDYLRRDSFYTGVNEGIISTGRIIKMLNIVNDELVIEEKGIYSIEKFIVARRLMYWQVYLHKTVLSAESIMVNLLKRAKFLVKNGKQISASSALFTFLNGEYRKDDFSPKLLLEFSKIDDYDILSAIKQWVDSEDFILSFLSKAILHRKLFKIRIQNTEFEIEEKKKIKKRVKDYFQISDDLLPYFFIEGKISNNAYNPEKDRINIYFKNGNIKDITEASDNFNIQALSSNIIKNYIAFPKDIL